MKKYTKNNEIIIVGVAEDIKATYKKLYRGTNEKFWPLYSDFPKFRTGEIYGIVIEVRSEVDSYFDGNFTVIGPSMVARLYYEGEIKEGYR